MRVHARRISAADSLHAIADPNQTPPIPVWLIRRLSPDSNPIDIQTLPKHSDEEMLLTAMGTETANVHLGTKGQTKWILEDIRRRKRRWLQDAAVRMAKILEKDWNHYQKR